jgi:hypothetical protein
MDDLDGPPTRRVPHCVGRWARAAWRRVYKAYQASMDRYGREGAAALLASDPQLTSRFEN